MDQQITPRQAEVLDLILTRNAEALDQLTSEESRIFALLFAELEDDELHLLRAQLRLLSWMFVGNEPPGLNHIQRQRLALQHYEAAMVGARRLSAACWLGGRTMSRRTSESDPVGFLLDALAFLDEVLD